MSDKWKHLCEHCGTQCGVDNYTGRMHWICRGRGCEAKDVPFTDAENTMLLEGIESQRNAKDLELTHSHEQITIEQLTADLANATARIADLEEGLEEMSNTAFNIEKLGGRIDPKWVMSKIEPLHTTLAAKGADDGK